MENPEADEGTPVVCSIAAKQWDTVALWSWDVQVELCAICKGTLADVCIECRSGGGGNANEKAAGDEKRREFNASGPTQSPHNPQNYTQPISSPESELQSTVPAEIGAASKKWSNDATGQCLIVWGVCNHVFHQHCISRWVQQKPTCPICGREWEVYKTEKNAL